MTDKPIVTGIAHLGIRVHDLDRARAFYELLGYTFVAGPVGPEPVAILSHPQAPEINLILNANTAEAPNILRRQRRRTQPAPFLSKDRHPGIVILRSALCARLEGASRRGVSRAQTLTNPHPKA